MNRGCRVVRSWSPGGDEQLGIAVHHRLLIIEVVVQPMMPGITVWPVRSSVSAPDGSKPARSLTHCHDSIALNDHRLDCLGW